MGNKAKKSIAVLGAGSWGTALAMLLARNGHDVRLWGRESDEIAYMAEHGVNPFYLPDVRFPAGLTPQPDLAAAMANVQDVLIVVPSHGFEFTLRAVLPHLNEQSRVMWATKGLDASGALLSQLAQKMLPWPLPLAVISGPSFAAEVAKNLPTAIAVASLDNQFAQDIAQLLHNDNFRPYTNNDMIGVQVCGAVKNGVAIASGISDGLGYGSNARCALITRALAEMTRLGIAMGGQVETFLGLAGVGDLVLTCSSDQSRNYRFGFALGQGGNADHIEQEIGQVVEGRQNAVLVDKVAQQHGVDMPIITEVCKVIRDEITPEQAVHELLERSMKPE